MTDAEIIEQAYGLRVQALFAVFCAPWTREDPDGANARRVFTAGLALLRERREWVLREIGQGAGAPGNSV